MGPRQIEALELRVAALSAGSRAAKRCPGDPAAEAGMDIGANEEVLGLLRDGNEVQAIALYRRWRPAA